MKQATPYSRPTLIKALIGEPVDLLVIGGGIVGAGIARDAAMRGLTVGLVEQNDVASGTSSRSSRLLHGGLRYLAQGRVGLVREASLEKMILHRIAPHLSEPLSFIFPSYLDNRHWVLWQLNVGVKIYDLLCGGRNFGKSVGLSKAEVLQKVPSLSETGLAGAVRYYDGFTSDARLTIDTLRSAAKHRAMILNYCRFKNANRLEFWECRVEDRLTYTNFKIRARAVVNATGPWAGNLPHSQVQLRLTKGIHLVVERTKIPITETVVMPEGKRILFAIPWGERTILGTTDTDYHYPPECATVDAADINYVLHVTNRFFPKVNLTAADVISAWAGLRPLIADAKGKPSDISRSHEIRSPEPFWWDVAGGKLTTYRLMAEQAVDQIIRKIGKRFVNSRTAQEPLLPTSEVEGVSGILPPALRRETVELYCANEWALHLDDIMVRRTSWHYYERDLNERAEKVAEWMGELLDWPEATRTEETRNYRALMRCRTLNPSLSVENPNQTSREEVCIQAG